MIKATEKEKNLLRELAYKVRQIAESKSNKEKIRLWYKFNELNPERPMILAFPEGAWCELIPEDTLCCENEILRSWEKTLKMKIYANDVLKDDQVSDPWFDINWQIDSGNFGVEIKRTSGEGRGSYIWESPIKDINEDFHKLKFREPSVNREFTYELKATAESIFGDILPSRIRGMIWWSLGMTWSVIDLIGLENFMLYMYDEPEGVHRLMAWMRDENLNYINWFEKEGLLSYNNESDYVGSGGVGYTTELPQKDKLPNAKVQLKDMWGFAESQETVGVSPDMFKEFVLPYQIPLLDKFGLNSYGCCEGLEKRIDSILKAPRIRRIAVSPWANQEIMAEKLGKNYIFSRKPNPSTICISFNEEEIRKDLRKTFQIAGNGVLEVIMKDTHTVQNQPWKISRWVEIAREELNK
ncbi:MAG TPA: hypothetical protein VIK72_16710 [Clostridiaceae bacterium]